MAAVGCFFPTPFFFFFAGKHFCNFIFSNLREQHNHFRITGSHNSILWPPSGHFHTRASSCDFGTLAKYISFPQTIIATAAADRWKFCGGDESRRAREGEREEGGDEVRKADVREFMQWESRSPWLPSVRHVTPAFVCGSFLDALPRSAVLLAGNALRCAIKERNERKRNNPFEISSGLTQCKAIVNWLSKVTQLGEVRESHGKAAATNQMWRS